MNAGLTARSAALFRERLDQTQRDANQLFFWLLLGEWLVSVCIALLVSPYTWEGRTRSLHTHVVVAAVFGGVLNVLPLVLIRRLPSSRLTPHVVAVTQMVWSALLIDLTGGRIETHFHIFGSLAFLAFYRHSGVLMTATAVVLFDHLVRGFFWPEAVYGTSNPEWWRALEHGAWVLFEVIVLILGIGRARRDVLQLADRETALEQTHATVERQVEQRTAELAESLARYRSLVENTNAIPWELDLASGKLLYIAPQAARLFGVTLHELYEGRFDGLVHPDDRARLIAHRASALAGQTADGDSVDYRMITGDGRLIHVRTSLSAFSPGAPLRGITSDISKQTKLEGELRQAHKLESVGKLAAGVAHEINTPVQFVTDSIYFVRSASEDLFGLLSRCRAAQLSILDGSPSLEEAQSAERLALDINLPYLTEQVPRALDLAFEGLTRVTDIVRSMKEFAYPHRDEMVAIDLNRSIQSTLTIAGAEYRYVAELETHFGQLPHVRCHPGDINQVVLNIVVNAAHAIGAAKRPDKGKIVVRTDHHGDDVVIAISDTGVGIPEHLHERIFDPFFTTKEVGSGTGQGLAIARTIVVDRHAGALRFESREGVGTTFYIRLPVAGVLTLQKPAA